MEGAAPEGTFRHGGRLRESTSAARPTQALHTGSSDESDAASGCIFFFFVFSAALKVLSTVKAVRAGRGGDEPLTKLARPAGLKTCPRPRRLGTSSARTARSRNLAPVIRRCSGVTEIGLSSITKVETRVVDRVTLEMRRRSAHLRSVMRIGRAYRHRGGAVLEASLRRHS